MLIDFHTHAFPDALAPKAMDHLISKSNTVPFTDGTLDGLKSKMELWDIDISVLLNIATNPKQQDKVNAFAQSVNETNDNIIAFGSVNPFTPDPEASVYDLKERGFKGIKLHPDYFELVLDDKRMMKIFGAAQESELVVAIHSGYDFISPAFIHATPERILKVITEFPKLKLVAAHMGANRMWREVLLKLCGTNVYFDTSLCAYEIDKKTAENIIKNHHGDKILFGSDMPWCSAQLSKMFVDSLDIPVELKENIYSKNAVNLLGL